MAFLFKSNKLKRLDNVVRSDTIAGLFSRLPLPHYS